VRDCSHIENFCCQGEIDVRGWPDANSVSVLTSLKVAVEQEFVIGKRFFYIMRSNHR